MFRVKNLKVEYMVTPVGIDVEKPRFSWITESDGKNVLQAGYTIMVKADQETFWEGGKESSASVHVVYEGKPLKSRTRYVWRVEVTDNYGNSASAESWFETGLGRGEWQAIWIETDLPAAKKAKMTIPTMGKTKKTADELLAPPTVFFKDFTLKGEIRRGRLYATAHGVYNFRVNGRKTDDRYLAPDFTPYDKWILYQTYDITGALKSGKNEIEITVSDGWYAGYMGLTGQNFSYGEKHALLAQLMIEYEDGTAETIITDQTFKAGTGRIRYADSFLGEKQDLRIKENTLNALVTEKNYGYARLTAQNKEPVRIYREIPAVKLFQDSAGKTIVDFGQVIAGFVKFTVQGTAGQKVKLEHSEVLNEKGEFIMNIAGVAFQTDTYILSGERETVMSEFTHHGFRFARMTGFPEEVKAEDFTAVMLSSDTGDAMEFVTSDSRLNRLWKNIIFSQKANTISIPTDCPQREKAGWTGDIQVFSATAVQNAQMDAFLTNWLQSVKLEQLPQGQVPIIVPYVKSYQTMGKLIRHTSAAWGDACVIVPYRLYSAYGDVRILEETYPVMVKWLDYVAKRAEKKAPLFKYSLNPKYRFNKKAKELQQYLWNTDFHFGDWLIPSKCADGASGMILSVLTKALVSPCYYAYSTMMIAEIAEILGKKEEAEKYRTIYAKIKEAFDYYYVNEDGSIDTDLQGIYVLAIHFGLIPENKKEGALSKLVQLIEKNGNRLDTGFASIEFLLDVLCDNGREDLAHKLLYQEECPGWLYEVKKGATTIWESWRAIRPEDGKVTNVSYNHYCFGCVADWMYRKIGGLTMLEPGFKKVRIAPEPDKSLNNAGLEYNSVYGTYTVHWEQSDQEFKMKVTIPANASAVVVLPDGTEKAVGSGEYTFTCGTGMVKG